MKQLLAAAALFAVTAGASQASVVGSFYDTLGLQDPGRKRDKQISMTAVETFLAGAVPDATFTSSGLDYGGPASFEFSDVAAFLGPDAATLSPGSAGSTSLLGSVFVFSGMITLRDGVNVFDIFSDDGFSLRIGGQEVARVEDLRPPSNAGTDNIQVISSGVTKVDFELVYFEGSLTEAALTARLNGHIIGSRVTSVPVPLSLALMLGGVGALGVAGICRRRAAA